MLPGRAHPTSVRLGPPMTIPMRQLAACPAQRASMSHCSRTEPAQHFFCAPLALLTMTRTPQQDAFDARPASTLLRDPQAHAQHLRVQLGQRIRTTTPPRPAFRAQPVHTALLERELAIRVQLVIPMTTAHPAPRVCSVRQQGTTCLQARRDRVRHPHFSAQLELRTTTTARPRHV